MPDHDAPHRHRHREPAGTAGTSRVTADAAPGAAPDAGDPEALATALGEAEKARDEYLDALQRERAAFANFKRRTADERDQVLAWAAEGLLLKVIGLADDFDRAIANRPAALADDPWAEGVAAIDRKLRGLLENEGVTPIDAAPGSAFDPRIHEAVTTVAGSGLPEGSVAAELRRGYRLRDRVLRPAMVATAAPPDDSDIPATHPTRHH